MKPNKIFFTGLVISSVQLVFVLYCFAGQVSLEDSFASLMSKISIIAGGVLASAGFCMHRRLSMPLSKLIGITGNLVIISWLLFWSFGLYWTEKGDLTLLESMRPIVLAVIPISSILLLILNNQYYRESK